MDLLQIGAIDIHAHPFTDEAILSLGPPFTEAAAFFGRSPESPEHAWVQTGKGLDIATTYQHMKEAGLSRAVLLNMVASHTWAKSLANDFIAEYCRAYPDMFLGMGGVDPHIGTQAAVREIERCAGDLELVGIKFHPAYQEFVPNDWERMYPLYEVMAELGMIALFHTGTTRMTRSSIGGCRPEFIDEVATAFPQLPIVMSHFGWPWSDEALAVTWRHEKVYLDLSGWMPRYIYGVSPNTIHYMNTVLSDKIMFGSDYPPIHPRVWIEDFSVLVQEGYEWGGRRHEFRPESVQRVMRDNAAALLGLQLP